LDFNAGSEEIAREGDVANLHDVAPTFPLEVLIGGTSVDQPQCRGSESILLVEDEVFVRTATAEVLRSAGYRVAIASSAAHAFEVQRGSFEFVDLLIADVVMPGLSGHDLAAQFRLLHPRVRVLMMSGYTEQLARSAMPINSSAYLAKPFSTSTLLRRVREVLDGKPSDFGGSA
jgi:DNA-binding NtrC family response regulator